MEGKITYGFLLLIVAASANAGLTPPSAPSDIDAFNARSDGRSGKKELNDIDCSEMNTSCTGCINLEHCYFAIANDDSTKCVDRNVEANMTVMKETIEDLDQCHGKSGEATKVSPKFDPNAETTTASPTTVNSTTSGSESTTTTTAATSSSTTTVSSTTTEKSTTQSSTTTETPTTAKPTTPSTQKPSTTTPVPEPAPRSGSQFDGWSFFGGILLTVGASAIAFVSYKYYKVRSVGQGLGGGANYSQF